MIYKFILVLDCGESWIVVFLIILYDSFVEMYILGIKEGRNYIKIVCYDSELQFCDVDILFINWVVVDVKVLCCVGVKLCDIDFCVIVCF